MAEEQSHPLAIAIRAGDLQGVRRELDQLDDVDMAIAIPSRNALHLAIEARNFRLVRLLLERGANPQAPLPSGLTPRRHYKYLLGTDESGLQIKKLIKGYEASDFMAKRTPKAKEANHKRGGCLARLFVRAKGVRSEHLAMLNSRDSASREQAVMHIGRYGDRRHIPQLVQRLRDWHVGAAVLDALDLFAWAPQTLEERVHVLLVKRDRSSLLSLWDDAMVVLLDDVRSSDYLAIENALFGFIGLGDERIIPILVDTLNRHGHKTMAEAFLNSGHTQLSAAATEWAEARGYHIEKGPGAHPIRWGRM